MDSRTRIAVELAVGAVLSVGLSIVFLINTEEQAAFATLAGLVGGVITLQVESILIDRRRAVHESKMGTLIKRLESVPWLADAVDKMTESAVRVEANYGRTPVAAISSEVFNGDVDKLAHLESGTFQYPWSDYSVLNGVLRETQSSMWVVSVVDADGDWWETGQAIQYWRLQKEILSRGVDVRRVFIYTEWSAVLAERAREQQAAGVKVRKVHVSRLHEADVGIIGIWDDTCGHDVSYNTLGKPDHFNFTVTKSGLEQLRQQFLRVEAEAVDINVEEPSARS